VTSSRDYRHFTFGQIELDYSDLPDEEPSREEVESYEDKHGK